MPGAGADIKSKELILLSILLHTDNSGTEVPLSFLFIIKSEVKMPLSLPSLSGLGSKFITEIFINMGLRESLERPLGADF